MVFTTGHSMLFPKDCGLHFGDMTDSQLRVLPTALTEREKAHPHAKYYEQVPAQLPEALRQAINGVPMDPSLAFEMKDYGKHMNNTGHCEVENGYCVLPSGVTYAAALIRQPGRTDEMVDLYNREFAARCGNLFYKIWNPETHYIHFENGCLEDFGFGRMKMKFAGPVQVEDLGMDPEKVAANDPACIQISGTTSIGWNLDGSDPEKAEWNTIVFYHRQTEYGREMRVRLWYGIGVQDGAYVYTIPPAEQAEHIARSTMIHVMKEYTNDEYLERTFWQDSFPVAK